MADVFVSYSKDDRPLIEEFSKFLEREGYVVWWDTRLVGGETFRG
jgi:TIR domain